MTVIDLDEQRTGAPVELATEATAPARWLLEMASADGVPLTQTNAIARAVVREIAERWPEWWNAELFGPPHREMDMPLLEELREGLKRRRLVRRRGRKLVITPRGRKLAADPIALLYEFGLDLGGGDAFTEMVAERIVEAPEESATCTREELVAPAHEAAQWGWCDQATGHPPSEQGVSCFVGDVLCRGEAYGLIDRTPDPAEPKSWRTLIALSPAGRLVLGRHRREVTGGVVYVFDAQLLNVPGVSATVAVAGHEHLTALHDAIQQAFNWENDHLYSFWLDGQFWGDAAAERVIPGAPDTDSKTADVAVDELRLKIGARIAYVFDYGDDWRVMLTLRERLDGSDAIPRVSARQGTAPPQYPPLDEENSWPEP
jgi:DNA-binding MarR family transcriptional regulator